MAKIDPFEFFDPRSGRVIRIQPIYTNPDVDTIEVAVDIVIACVSDPNKWFAVKLDTGEITIAAVDLTTKRWTKVPEYRWPSIPLNEGLPEKFQTVKCPVCDASVDVMFPCSEHVSELYTFCPRCGYNIDVEQAMIVDEGGGTDEL